VTTDHRHARREATVLADLAALSRAAADLIVEAAARSVADRGRFTIALSGGHTPRLLYRLLGMESGARMPWAETWVFFADERCVPPSHPESNYGMVRDELLARIPGIESRTLRIEGERAPIAAAARYDGGLHAAFDDRDSGTFDVAVLGVGTDGHTASLFPGSPVLSEKTAWAAAASAPPGSAVIDRVTLTFPTLDAARTILVLCAGRDKRRILTDIRAAGASAADRYPAARVTARERLYWLLDREAVPVAGGVPFDESAPT
jgi:6-phosphogluconolactonase